MARGFVDVRIRTTFQALERSAILPRMKAASARINKGKLWLVFGLTAGYMVAEAVTGLLTKSLALLADAGHMLTDAGALGLSLLAIWFSERPSTPERSFGYYRAEILAAFVNALVLLLMSFYIVYEACAAVQKPSGCDQLAHADCRQHRNGRQFGRYPAIE